MKATLRMEVTAASAQSAHARLTELCERMTQEGLITGCSFEIETPDGLITDRCLLGAEGRVIA